MSDEQQGIQGSESNEGVLQGEAALASVNQEEQQAEAAKKARAATKVFSPEEAIAALKGIESDDILPAARRCIEKLIREINDLKYELSNGDMAKMREENEKLKNKLSAIREASAN